MAVEQHIMAKIVDEGRVQRDMEEGCSNDGKDRAGGVHPS